jgi:hypothetical protein
LASAAVQPAIDGRTAPIEAAVDTVAACVETLGGPFAAASLGSARGAIEPLVGPVAAHVQPVLDAVASPIEPLLDAVALGVGACAGVRGSLRRAGEQAETERYCSEFHFWPPWPRLWPSLLTTGLARRPLTRQDRLRRVM